MVREKTILVVAEENPAFQDLKACLNKAGYRVARAAGGEEAFGEILQLSIRPWSSRCECCRGSTAGRFQAVGSPAR